MSEYAYDADQWLVSTMRVIAAYVQDQLQAALGLTDDDMSVEMSFPDTTKWTKDTPLSKLLVHFELDDAANPVLGFGTPGVGEYTEPEGDNAGTYLFKEAAKHVLNFDVGIWVSSEMGGATKRMQTMQALSDMFATSGGRQAFNAATEGLNITSFEGGQNALDRINDIPIWRTMGMTLMVAAFSRHTPDEPDLVPLDFLQNQELTIVGEDGSPEPVVT